MFYQFYIKMFSLILLIFLPESLFLSYSGFFFSFCYLFSLAVEFLFSSATLPHTCCSPVIVPSCTHSLINPSPTDKTPGTAPLVGLVSCALGLVQHKPIALFAFNKLQFGFYLPAVADRSPASYQIISPSHLPLNKFK